MIFNRFYIFCFLAFVALLLLWFGKDPVSFTPSTLRNPSFQEWIINYPPMRALVCNRVWQLHQQTPSLENRWSPGRLLIVFSAVPGTGVSRCAEKIAEELHGEIISSNNLRDDLRALGVAPQKRDQKKTPWIQYAMATCLQRSSKSPHVIVLDKTIDRSYPLVKAWCKRHGWWLRVIRLDYGNKQTALNLLSQHPKSSDYLPHFEAWYRDYECFTQEVDLSIKPLQPGQRLDTSTKTTLSQWLQQAQTPPTGVVIYPPFLKAI